MSRIINIFGSLASVDVAFKFTVDTTKAGSASDTFILPLVSGATYNFVVDWGDASSDTILTYNDPNLTHVYASSGTYQISLTGTYGRIFFNTLGDILKLMTIDNWGTNLWESCDSMFYGCANMTANYTDTPKMENSVSHRRMFRQCTLFNGIVDNWNMLSSLSAVEMFYNSSSFNQSFNSWTNTGLITSFNNILRNTIIWNHYVGDIDISSVTAMSNAWRGATGWSRTNYGNTLSGWIGWTGGVGGSATRPVQSGVSFRCSTGVDAGTDGEYARNYLITVKGWAFTDSGVI